MHTYTHAELRWDMELRGGGMAGGKGSLVARLTRVGVISSPRYMEAGTFSTGISCMALLGANTGAFRLTSRSGEENENNNEHGMLSVGGGGGVGGGGRGGGG